MASFKRAFPFSAAYVKHGSLVWLDAAAGGTEWDRAERWEGQQRGRAAMGEARTCRAHGKKEYDREMGSGE